jgi:hypothetical protein
MSVEKGKIENLKILGDYFFTLPTEEFCNRMTGTPHTPDAVLDSVQQMEGDINSYFSNITVQEIASLFFE